MLFRSAEPVRPRRPDGAGSDHPSLGAGGSHAHHPHLHLRDLLDAGGGGTDLRPGRVRQPHAAPATPEGEALLRTSYMATHTEALLDEAMDIIADVMVNRHE